MNEPMEKRHHGLPDLQALDSSPSEETLALNSSSSSEFEDEYLNEKVDLITTTIGKSPPIIPLREERMTLGVECVYKAKGVGWSGVKKKRKKSKTSDSKEGCHQNICHKPLLQCFTNCSPVYDDDYTPKNSNTTKDRLLDAELKALSYPEYVDYLLRCRAKKKEYIEHPYLELEQSKDADDMFKRRIFTRQLEARQETFDSAAISDYIVKGPVQQNEVRQNPSVSFDPLVRYYDINESDPSDTKIVYGAANDIDLLPSLQYNTKKSKTVSFADVGKKRPIYPPSQTEDDNNIDSNVGCCRYKNILEESFMQSGKDNMSRDSMKFMGVSDTTIATTTYCAVDIEGFNARKRTKESESLHFSRSSSLMDSVNPKGSISQDGMIVPLSASSCIDMQHSESHENRYECPDDSREQGSYHEERQSPSADACDSNIDSDDASDDDGIFSYIRTPRENRFHFYFPDQVRFEESECINRQDTALQESFAKSDSDGTPLISNGVMKSSSMGSGSNFIQSHSVEHNVEAPSRSNEASYDLKTTLDEAKVCANTMQSTSALSDEDGVLATTLDNIAGIKSQTVSPVGCSVSFTQGTEVLTKKSPAVSASRKSDETNICDVSMQSSHKKNSSSFVSLSTVENNIDHRSKPCSSIGCSTSFEWNSRSSTSKSFDRRVLNDSGITERQQSPDLKQDSQAVSSPSADISIESGVKSFCDSGEVKVCNDVRQQSPALKQDSHVVSAPRPATNIERKTQSELCDDVSRQSPTLEQDSHVASVPRANETIKHRARPCSSIGCSTSFEIDMHSSPEKTFTDSVTIKDPNSSKAATGCVEEQFSCVESENIAASQMTAKPKHTAESNHKTSEIGVQTSISVSDLSLDGTRSRSPRKSPTYSIKGNAEATLDDRLEDRNEETSQYPTMVDNRSPDSSKSYKHGNNVSDQSTWGKVDGDLPTLGSHVINKHSTPNHFFIKEDNDSINNDDNYEFTIPNSLSIDSCHSSLYSDEMSATYSSHKEYAGNPRNLPPLPRASEGRKGDKQDALSFTYTLPKSLSLSSYHSANTSLFKSSSMTHAEVEQCISYTLSELGRIHSMLDDANIQCNMDSMSCNSESTEGRDALYYARQSKNEIAALQNLIEQHINREKESNFNNRKLVKNGSYVSKITGEWVAESSSFETMMSAKSQSSTIVENPSLDRLILDVSKLCTDIETRIENIVNDTNGSN